MPGKVPEGSGGSCSVGKEDRAAALKKKKRERGTSVCAREGGGGIFTGSCQQARQR